MVKQACYRRPHLRGPFALNTELTYDWKAKQWAVPINFNVAQLLRVGDQLLQVGAGVRYWAAGDRRSLPRTGIPLVRTICRSTLCLTLSGASARLHKP